MIDKQMVSAGVLVLSAGLALTVPLVAWQQTIAAGISAISVTYIVGTLGLWTD